jgi:hypothetical protein
MIGSVYSKEFVSACKSRTCVHSQSLINCTWSTATNYSIWDSTGKWRFFCHSQCYGPASGSGLQFWCRSGSYFKFYTWRKVKLFTFIHSSTSIHCFIFLGSVVGVIICHILGSIVCIFKFLWKSVVSLSVCWNRWGSGSGEMTPIRPDPDPQHWS